MSATSFLHHRNGLAHFPMRLEISENQDVVGELAHVDRRLHRASHEPHLRKHHERHDSAIV